MIVSMSMVGMYEFRHWFAGLGFATQNGRLDQLFGHMVHIRTIFIVRKNEGVNGCGEGKEKKKGEGENVIFYFKGNNSKAVSG